jgi:hypothetical protein
MIEGADAGGLDASFLAREDKLGLDFRCAMAFAIDCP